MNTGKILSELRAERARIDHAIKAIESLGSAGRKVGGRTVQAKPRRRRRQLSAAARKRLSELMKKRWASGKMGKRRKSA